MKETHAPTNSMCASDAFIKVGKWESGKVKWLKVGGCKLLSGLRLCQKSRTGVSSLRGASRAYSGVRAQVGFDKFA